MTDHDQRGPAFWRRSLERYVRRRATRQTPSGILPTLFAFFALGLCAGGVSFAAERSEASPEIANAFGWVLDLWETPATETAPPPALSTVAIGAPVEAAEAPAPTAPVIAVEAPAQAPSLPFVVLSDPWNEQTEQAGDTTHVDERPIGELTTDIRPIAGPLPADHAASLFAQRGSFWFPAGTTRPWAESPFAWTAPALCHQPLYFEEISLERYGYAHRWTQPLFSAAHFFGRIPALPYLAVVDCPSEPIYSLGYYRPGSCAPRQVRCLPLRWDASAAEAAAVAGLIFLVP